MHFVAALDRKPQMRCVLGLFEGVVTGAADGYGRMRRRPAATLLHTGPGLANGLANLHNARRASTPIINVVGDHASYHLKYDAPLTSDIESLARPMSNWVQRATSAETVADTVGQAYHAALTLPGVATMILPADAAWGEVANHQVRPIDGPSPPLPETETLRKVAEAIRRHRGRFAILVGGEAALEKGTTLAGQIAEAYQGKLFAEVLPARIAKGRGRPSPPSIPYPLDLALQTLKDIDLLVLVGTTEPVAFFGYPGRPSRLLPETSEAFCLATRSEDQVGGLRALADELDVSQGHWAGSVPGLEPVAHTGILNKEALGYLIAQHMPEGAIVCDEGGVSSVQFRALGARAAPYEVMSVTGGSIGIGIPLSIGAAIACPDRKVVNLQADGSAMYTVQGLWTEARENLNILTIVFSNRAYAMLQIELRNLGVNDVGHNATRIMSLDEPALDWVKLANGMGIEAVRVETNEAFADILPTAMRRSGPFLIECVLD